MWHNILSLSRHQGQCVQYNVQLVEGDIWKLISVCWSFLFSQDLENIFSGESILRLFSSRLIRCCNICIMKVFLDSVTNFLLNALFHQFHLTEFSTSREVSREEKSLQVFFFQNINKGTSLLLTFHPWNLVDVYVLVIHQFANMLRGKLFAENNGTGKKMFLAETSAFRWKTSNKIGGKHS